MFAVNGTLMRGMDLNANLLALNATFVCETATQPIYRLWSIDDRYPAMIRVRKGGVKIVVEVWSVPTDALASILLNEPNGMTIGKVSLADGTEVFGVLAEPVLCEGQQEITSFGGWRAYAETLGSATRPAPSP